MTNRPTRKPGGFSRFEFAVAAALFGVLVAVFAGRVWYYQAEAERVAVKQLVGTVRIALQVRAAQLLAAGGEQALRQLADENPIAWLSHKPTNYAGEYDGLPPAGLPSGSWFFDRADRSLVYLPHRDESFSDETSRFLKFKVKFLSSPSASRGNAAQGVVFDQVSGQAIMNID
ncbi:hypothetical protein [Massilia horti]|uniref:Type II secretion system protein n=1 Tax=Massilia horti TaxID=2562153 RepID=A0A4Y9T0G9_9BURK|nr:hypothetical protein [Massilia horti]TFW30988.1 hypothetical protein E4O92_14865 [Massilia horti]